MNKKTPGSMNKREGEGGQYYLRNDASQARLGLLLLIIPIVGFIFNDYQFFSTSSEFFGLVAIRSGLLIYTVLQLFYLTRVKNSDSYEKSMFAYALIAAICVLIINGTRPQNFAAQTIIVMLGVFIFYLVIPNRFVSQTVTALVITIGEVFIIILGTNTPVATLFSVFLSLFLAMAVAALGSWQLQIYRGKGYAELTELRQAEEATRQSEERFSKAFHTNPVAMTITLLPEGKWIDVNESFLRLVEYNREEIIGHNSTELNMFDGEPAERAHIISILREKGSISNYEIGARTKSGKHLRLLFSAVVINLNGQDHAITMRVDITERKQMQDKLEEYTENLEQLVEERAHKLLESEQSYKDLYESFDEAFIATDWEFNVIHWNKAAERITTVASKRMR